MYDVVLSGYYGFKNSGDEALLKSIISDLKRIKNDIRIAVLSNDPEFTEKTYGVYSVRRMNFPEIKTLLKNTRLLISGGGSLIQDATSTKSLLYYLGIIKLAKICGAKVMVYANGVGPVSKKLNRRLTRCVLNDVDFITLREPDSKEELEKTGVTKPEMLVTADPAMGIKPCGNAEELKKRLFGEKPLIAVSVRCWQGYDEKIISSVSGFAEEFKRNGYSVFMLPMQYSKDEEICRAIAQSCGITVLPEGFSVEEVAGILSCCKAVVGMRLHSIIYAAAAGSIPVGIVYDPKVESFMKYMGLDSFVDVRDITASRLVEIVSDAITSGKKADVSGFENLALKNAEIAASLLQ